MHLWIIFIAIAILIARKAEAGQRCFECHEVPTPQTCSRVTECGEHEQCFVESIVTTSGSLLYNVGCIPKERCSERKRTSGVDKRDNLVTCLECCSQEDFCNVAGCGHSYVPRVNRGPYCFHCDVQENQHSCLDVVVCGKDQECLLELNLDFPPKVYYRSKCGDKSTCLGAQEIHNSQNPALDPSGLIVGRRNTENGDCPACCNTDFCNDICTVNNSVAIHGTQAPITTQFVTQAPITTQFVTHVHLEHTSTQMPQTTHAQTTAEPPAIQTHSVLTKETPVITHVHHEHTSTHMPETTHAQTTAEPPAIKTHSVLTKATPAITHVHQEISSTHTPSITHVVQDCSKKGYGYVQTRHMCIKFHFDIVNFNHAAVACAREGATLVTIDTQEKMSEIWTELHKISGYVPDLWIGGSDIYHNDTFYWQTGSKVYTFTNWGKIIQQPNDPHYHDQDCIILHKSDNYTWYDEPCYRDYGFICEHPMPATHTGTPDSQPCESHPGFQLLEHNLGCVEYVRIPTDRLTAHNYCRMFDSHLVNIESEDKQQAIFQFIRSKNASATPWIGLVGTRTGSHNRHDWQWEAGSPYSYSKWDHGDPNADGNCVIIFTNEHWRDRDCTEHHSFVCEKDHL